MNSQKEKLGRFQKYSLPTGRFDKKVRLDTNVDLEEAAIYIKH